MLRQSLQYLPVAPLSVGEAAGLMMPQRECEGLIYGELLHRGG
jgi:hypothetical protein